MKNNKSNEKKYEHNKLGELVIIAIKLQIVNPSRTSTAPISQLIPLVAEAHLAEGQLQHLKSTRNKLKSLKFPVGKRRLKLSKRVGQNFDPF